MTDAPPDGRAADRPGGALLPAWLKHEAALWARLSVEPRRIERRALWRALAHARQVLDRIDPARGGDADAPADPFGAMMGVAFGTDDPFPPSVDQVLASGKDEWDLFLDQLEQGPDREPDAAP